jgi:hypothetical protein
MRRIVDALIYQSRSGCRWSLLPSDFPPASAVKYYIYLWRDEGVDEVIHELLRCRVRKVAGRSEDPSLVVLDTPSVHAAVNVPAATTGRDAAKLVPGRKRGIAVDVFYVCSLRAARRRCPDESTRTVPGAIGQLSTSRGPRRGTAPTAASTASPRSPVAVWKYRVRAWARTMRTWNASVRRCSPK